jgi:hypothetical protein
MKIDYKKIINIKNEKDLKDFPLDKPLFMNNYLFHYLIELDNLPGLKLHKFPIYLENNENMNGFHIAANKNNIETLEYLIEAYPDYIYNRNTNNELFTFYLQPNEFNNLIKKYPKLDWNYLILNSPDKKESNLIFKKIIVNLNFTELKTFMKIFKIEINLLLPFGIYFNNILTTKQKINLLDNFSDEEINIKNNAAAGLIMLAIENDNQELFDYLLKRNIDIDYYISGGLKNPLINAIYVDINNNKKYYSKKILEKLVKINPKFYLSKNKFLENNCFAILKLRFFRNQQITDINKLKDIDYSIETDILDYGDSEAFNELNIDKVSLLHKLPLFDFDIYSKILIKNNIKINPKTIEEIEKNNEYDYDKRWLELYKNLPKYEEKENDIIIINNEYSHSTLYRATFKDIVFYVLYLNKIYPELYIPKLTSYQLNNLTFENSMPISDNLITKEPVFPWTIIYISENEYYIHPFLNNLINAERRKGEKRFVFICLGIMYITTRTWHANSLICDFKNMTIERFEPYGNSCEIDSEMDNILEEELTWSTGLKYVKSCDYLPYAGFQSISDENNYGNQKPGDFGGFCLAWSLWYVEMRMKNPNVEPKILVEKLINKINNLDIKFSEYIRNYANKLNNKRIDYFKKIGIDSKMISNIYQTDNIDDKIAGFILQQMTS